VDRAADENEHQKVARWGCTRFEFSNPAGSGTGFGVTFALLAAVAGGIVLSVT
jgi:hypothetical protein